MWIRQNVRPEHVITTKNKYSFKDVVESAKVEWDLFYSNPKYHCVLQRNNLEREQAKTRGIELPIWTLSCTLKRQNFMHQTGIRHYSQIDMLLHVGQILENDAVGCSGFLTRTLENSPLLFSNVTNGFDKNDWLDWSDMLEGINAFRTLALADECDQPFSTPGPLTAVFSSGWSCLRKFCRHREGHLIWGGRRTLGQYHFLTYCKRLTGTNDPSLYIGLHSRGVRWRNPLRITFCPLGGATDLFYWKKMVA